MNNANVKTSIQWISTNFFLIVLLVLIVAAYYPSYGIPYFGEDIGSHLPEASSPFQCNQFWRLHQEHFIPLIKLIYRFCYHFFWMNPAFFHFLIVITFCLTVIILNKLLYKLSHSRSMALFGSALFGLSTVYDGALVEISNSQTSFCLFFCLAFLYSLYRYFENPQPLWKYSGVFCGFFAVCTFALGIFIGLWGALFFYCCIPREYKSS